MDLRRNLKQLNPMDQSSQEIDWPHLQQWNTDDSIKVYRKAEIHVHVQILAYLSFLQKTKTWISSRTSELWSDETEYCNLDPIHLCKTKKNWFSNVAHKILPALSPQATIDFSQIQNCLPNSWWRLTLKIYLAWSISLPHTWWFGSAFHHLVCCWWLEVNEK